jgi:hypothetical protein
MTPELGVAIPPHLARVKASLGETMTDRIYLNFAEHPSDTSKAYTSETFSALQAVKAKYDPRDTIHANHAIAPASR